MESCTEQQQLKWLSSRTLRVHDAAIPELHTFTTAESMGQLLKSGYSPLGFDTYYILGMKKELTATLEVTDGRYRGTIKQLDVTLKVRYIKHEDVINESQADGCQPREDELDHNLYLASISPAELTVIPYDSSGDDKGVDIDLLYRWDTTPTGQCKLHLKTYQEPIPRVPAAIANAAAAFQWACLGESVKDHDGQLLLKSYVRAFLNSFPNDELLEKFKSFKGMRAAKAWAARTRTRTRGVQFRGHILPNGEKCVIIYAETVPEYTSEDGILKVCYRWFGDALVFLIKRKDEPL